MEQDNGNTVDLSSLGSLDFTPDWAKKDAGVSVGKVRPEREERKPFGGDRKPGNGRQNDSARSYGGGTLNGGQKPRFDKPRSERPRFMERPKPLDCEVKILPDTKALGTIIRKLQQDFHAYKLKDLAYFFLDNPSSILLKITPRNSQPTQSPLTFHQCKACGFASVNEQEVIDHILNSHLSEYFDAKEVECEPPKGNFNCVAKCGLSGVLLGPPNIHEFNSVIKEMLRTRYPDMSESDYRSRIEMVREPEAIEQWRQSCTRKTVYVPKGAGEGEAATMSREQVEGEFRRVYLPALLDQPKHLMITAEVAMKCPVKPLVWAVRDAIEAERRAPYAMCFALRGAFHHRKLNFFRANDARGQEFVTGTVLKEFDATHAVPELAQVAQFIAEHPCSAKNEIVKDSEGEKHLAWLVSTGHVVAFTNGVYSAVEKFPKYGPQWRKKAAATSATETVESKETEKAPAVEKAPESTEEAKEEVKQNEAADKLVE